MVAAPKNGRSARIAPVSKPEMALTDPFEDEPEVVVSATEEDVLVAVAEPVVLVADPEPAPVAPAPVAPAPIVSVPAPTPAVTVTVGQTPRCLPDERQSLTLTLKAGGCEGLVIVGLFEDGAPGEVLLLLRSAPAGATAVLEAFTATLTLALPYGIPAGVLANQLLALVDNASAHAAAQAIATSLSTRF